MNLKKLLSALLIAALLLTPVAMMEGAFEPQPEVIEEPAQAPVEEALTKGEESEPVEIVTPEAVDEITEENADAVLDDLDPTVQVNVDLPEEKLLFAPMFEEGETTEGIDIIANFLDEFFCNFVLTEIDINHDQLLSPDEIANIEDIYLSPDFIDEAAGTYESKSITSLEGIEYFTNLKTLELSNFESIGSFDISKNTALKTLEVSYSGLNAQDWSKNPALKRLSVHDCGLTTLDVSKNTALEELICYGNQLTALDVSKNTALFNLDCSFNAIKKLDITKNSKLLPCVLQGTKKVETSYGDEGSSIVYVWSSGDDEEAYILCDPTTEIITEETKTSEDTSTVTAPTSTPVPVIAAVKKSSKTTITAAPGSTYQLDLAGATGKSFKSSKKKVATVSKTGLVTVKKAGKTKITLKVGKKKRTVTLTVKDPTIPTSVSLNMAGTNAVTKGESVTLTATLPEGTYSGIKWKSSNKKVATVSKTGVVKFKKAGKVTITATASRGKKKAKVKFKVSK